MGRFLHRQAAGPFMLGGSAALLRPYGSLFALTRNDEHIFSCAPTGALIYEVRLF